MAIAIGELELPSLNSIWDLVDDDDDDDLAHDDGDCTAQKVIQDMYFLFCQII